MKEEASQCFQTALAMGVGQHELGVRGLLSYFEREACHWHGADEGLAALKAALDALPDDAVIATAPFAHVTLLDDPGRAAEGRTQPGAPPGRTGPPLRAAQRLAPDMPAPALGYLSADFHQHATCILMAEMLEHHDREPLRGHAVLARQVRRQRDAPAHRAGLRTLRRPAGLSDGDIAARIRADGCDLLIDLKGYTRNHRVGVLRLAAGTGDGHLPGLSRLDRGRLHRLPDRRPGGHAAGACGVLQRDTWPRCRCATSPTTASVPCRRRPRGPSAGLPDDAWCWPASTSRTRSRPQVFDVWCVLLDALPQAVLWLLEWNAQSRENLEREAVTRGIDPARIVWAPRKKPADHMARMQLADLFLDTWPCNAHTTASDALWAGVPVVTFTGQTFASRVAASLVHAVGLGELACRDIEHYARTVVELATTPSAGAPARQRWWQRAHGVAAVRQPALHARLRGAVPAHDAAPRGRAAAGSPAAC
jgi:protein O-GlcNAc transferase